MKWINITDENGQIDASKLPKEDCSIVARYHNPPRKESYYFTMGFSPDYSACERHLFQMEATHILILTDPNAPQPEDILLDALMDIECHPTSDYEDASEMASIARSALSAWEGGKA